MPSRTYGKRKASFYTGRSKAVAQRKRAKTSYRNQVYIPRPLVTSNGLIVDLPYVQELTLQTGITTEVFRQFRGASIYDPDFTGAGHQPLGHDQWAALYQRYRVISSKCEVYLSNSSNMNDNDPIWIVLAGTETSNTLSVAQWAEQPFSKCAMIGPQGNGQKKLSIQIKTSDLEGDYGAKYDKEYTAAFGANPSREFFYTIGVRNTAGNNNIQVFGYIKIVYKVLMYDRIDLQAS